MVSELASFLFDKMPVRMLDDHDWGAGGYFKMGCSKNPVHCLVLLFHECQAVLGLIWSSEFVEFENMKFLFLFFVLDL